MENYKYEYIPDKKMYAAVMGACSMIRDTGYFNRAVAYYASKYGVDEEDLKAHIRKRQAVGQKGKKKGTYKFFLVERWTHYQYRDEYREHKDYSGEMSIEKGISEDSVRRRFIKGPHEWGLHNESFCAECCKIHGEYATRKDAEAALEKLFRHLSCG